MPSVLAVSTEIVSVHGEAKGLYKCLKAEVRDGEPLKETFQKIMEEIGNGANRQKIRTRFRKIVILNRRELLKIEEGARQRKKAQPQATKKKEVVDPLQIRTVERPEEGIEIFPPRRKNGHRARSR